MLAPLSLALPLLAALSAHAAKLTIQTPRVAVSGPDGAQLLSEQLSIAKVPSKPVTLGPKDVLKLTFQVVESDGEKPVQPHQAFVRFFDETTGEEGIQPVKVNTNGKAKLELNMARPPPSLPPTGAAPLKVSVLLGSFTHDPASFDLLALSVPPSAPVVAHPDAALFAPRAEITHTFRPEPRVPPAPVSALFTGLVIAPWAVLLGLWAAVRPAAPRLLAPNVLGFALSLAGTEGLLLWYWLELRLGQVLLYGALVAIPTLITGKSALKSIAAHRLGQK